MSGSPIIQDGKLIGAAGLERDNAFLQKYSKKELDEIQQFMMDFNNYLEDKIAEIGGHNDVN